MFSLFLFVSESKSLSVFCTAFRGKEISDYLAHGPMIQVLDACLKEQNSLIPQNLNKSR